VGTLTVAGEESGAKIAMALRTVQHPGYSAPGGGASRASSSRNGQLYSDNPDNPEPLTSIDHDLPDDFEFDIVAELSGPRRGLYSSKRSKTDDGVTQLSIYNLPLMVSYSCERIAPTIGGKTEPSIGTILACCLYYGLSRIASSRAYKTLVEIHSDLASLSPQIANAPKNRGKVSEVKNFLSMVSSAAPTLNDVRSERKNIWIPQWMMDGLLGVSQNLGMSNSVVSVMGILICLSRQAELLEEHRQEMERAAERFVSRIELRSSMSQAAMEWLRRDLDSYR